MNVGALALGVALLVANGFFVAAEFALLAARRSRMEQLAADGDRRAAIVLESTSQLSLMLAGAQLGITMASLALGAVTEPAIHHWLEEVLHGLPIPRGVSGGLSIGLTLAIVVFLHMVVGEMAPKSWAIARPERAAQLLILPFRGFVLVLRPFIALLNGLANFVVRLCGVTPADELAATHSATDLLLLVRESAEQGSLPRGSQHLLARALQLSGLDAEAVMVPRRDIVGIDLRADVDDVERIALASGRSRLPVYDRELDRVRGVLHVKDVLALEGDERASATAGSLARPALISPESRAVEDLMLDMRQQRQHIALVMDEYGTVSGLVSLEDLLEELIGEFEDESDRRDLPVRRGPGGALIVAGTTRADELRDAAGIVLPDGEWETVAGYVIAALDRIPAVGEAVEVDGRRLIVAKMDGHRIVELRVVTAPGSSARG